MKFINYLLLFLSITLGCTHKCPEFNEDLLSWTPYAINDQIILRNEADSSLVLMVRSLQIDHTTSYPSMALCTCSDMVHVDISGGNVNIPVDLLGHENNESFDLQVFKMTWKSMEYISCESKLINFSLNNMVFSNSWMIELCLPDGENPVGKIVFAESIGLIYIEINEETFQLQSTDSKSPEIHAFNFKEEPC